MSPYSFLFSRLNKPNSLGLSSQQDPPLDPLQQVHVLLVLRTQSQAQCPRGGLRAKTYAERAL